jgi:hypothetical protein
VATQLTTLVRFYRSPRVVTRLPLFHTLAFFLLHDLHEPSVSGIRNSPLLVPIRAPADYLPGAAALAAHNHLAPIASGTLATASRDGACGVGPLYSVLERSPNTLYFDEHGVREVLALIFQHG